MMGQGKLILIVGVAVLLVTLVGSAFYTVDEREKAIVIQFGQVVREDEQAGLHFKYPLIQTVRYFDSRILTLDAEPQRFLTQEKKSVVVDSFVKWRVVDPLKFYLTVGGDEERAKTLLNQRVNGGLRNQFGERTLRDVVSGDRREIMNILTKQTNEAAGEYGIEVVDVRLQRVDLPVEVSQSVYQRMESERARIAKELRAKGAEAAEKIRADADRQRQILLAEAYRQAERTRGQGDAIATATYARAYKRYPEFYSLYRSLNAYKTSFSGKEDIMIVDPSSDFFKYLKKPRGR